MPTTCDRCHQPANISTGSWFNMQMICMICSDEEEAHPDCAYAKEVESQACAGGNFNFEGVGWPGVGGRVSRSTGTA